MRCGTGRRRPVGGRGVAHALRAGTVLAGVGAAGFGGAVESVAGRFARVAVSP
jgi:glucosyl-dolichyl phosphate glucuronosyltransferase